MSSQQPDGMWVKAEVVMALEAEIATLRMKCDDVERNFKKVYGDTLALADADIVALEAEIATLRQERHAASQAVTAMSRALPVGIEAIQRLRAAKEAAEAENARLRARVIQLEESMNPMDVPPEPAETDHE